MQQQRDPAAGTQPGNAQAQCAFPHPLEAAMNRTPLSVLMATLLAGAMLSGCSQPQPEAVDTAAAASGTTPSGTTPSETAQSESSVDAFRFNIGALEAVALKDGDLEAPNDGTTFAIGQPTEQVAALLAAAGEPTDVLHLGIQPLLVHAGDRVLLFDTGAGDVEWARGGRLPASLRAAGVAPSQVTDIFISHRHADHVGGLLARDGALAFPNATVHLTTTEWAGMQADADAAALVAAIAPKVAAFEPGAELVPGTVTAVVDNGHTPGHSAYLITSGGDRLLYIGDTAHHFVVSVQRPEWTVDYDMDAPLAQTRRRELLQRAADDGTRVYAVHFPFPGLGRFETQGESFVWVPER
jgi:glyoxylase-like metal-dependent hydrolase (beta-lactamase superfamily II)